MDEDKKHRLTLILIIVFTLVFLFGLAYLGHIIEGIVL